MFRLNAAQLQPIGLDIGHDSIKMLQLAVAGNSLEVHAAARHMIEQSARQQPETFMPYAIGAIRRMLKSGGFRGRNVVACLPRQIVHTKNLRLPMMPVSELAAVVQFEAHNVFSFDTTQARIEFLSAGEVRQGADVRQEVIAVAALHQEVDQFLELLHNAGVVVDSLDIEPCALYRSVERFVRRREDEHEVFVLVDVGLSRSQVLIGRGREISFVKPVEVAGGKFNEAVSRKLGISYDEARALRRRLTESKDAASTRDPVRQAVSDATRSTMEDLAREVSLCLRYYSVTFRGHRPTKLRLVGGEASDPQLLSILATMLPIPIESGRPLFSIDVSAMKPADRKGAGSEWALALGLGLKRTQGRFAPRDGTPRAQQIVLPAAEVIDLNAAIPAAATGAAPLDNRAPVRLPLGPEVVHA